MLTKEMSSYMSKLERKGKTISFETFYFYSGVHEAIK